MMADAFSRASLITLAVIAVCGFLHWASVVFAPLVFALLIIAVLWPIQKALQSQIGGLLALIVTLFFFVAVLVVLGSMVAWSLSRVGQALTNDTARLQALYDQLAVWLEGHGIAAGALISEHIDIGWYVRLVQSLAARLHSTLSFWLIVIVYTALGLLEMGDFKAAVLQLRNSEIARVLSVGSTEMSARIRSYFVVRTQMSVLTGLLVFGVTTALGLPLAKEWGVLAFVLNYIPFLGSMFATLFPTVYAIAEFQSWEAPLLVFLLLNVIQIAVGSYIEPRVTGSALSISPLLVIFSVFFWGYMWGIFGAFVGVPISIAILTYCEQSASTRWVKDLFGGGAGRTP
jgi:AI-2 transport protein TqsA